MFKGFDLPERNYFSLPNEWIDLCAKLTKRSEILVIQYVLRHTWGFREYGIPKRITVDEFIDGRKYKNQTRMDNGTGLSRSSVQRALKQVVEDGYLIEYIDDRDLARVQKYYMLLIKDDCIRYREGGGKLSPESISALQKNNVYIDYGEEDCSDKIVDKHSTEITDSSMKVFGIQTNNQGRQNDTPKKTSEIAGYQNEAPRNQTEYQGPQNDTPKNSEKIVGPQNDTPESQIEYQGFQNDASGVSKRSPGSIKMTPRTEKDTNRKTLLNNNIHSEEYSENQSVVVVNENLKNELQELIKATTGSKMMEHILARYLQQENGEEKIRQGIERFKPISESILTSNTISNPVGLLCYIIDNDTKPPTPIKAKGRTPVTSFNNYEQHEYSDEDFEHLFLDIESPHDS